MNDAGVGEHIPPSIGGVIGFAWRAWAANAPLYLALQLGVFAAYSLAEVLIPAATASSPHGQFKQYVLLFTGLFADALVVATVALGVAARGAGVPGSAGVLLGAAIERWLPVIAVSCLAQFLVLATADLSGLGPPSEPRVLQYVTAPIVWVLWAVLGLTAPFVALAPNRRAFSVITGFVHAFTTSLRRSNMLRLCVLAVFTVLPTILQTIAFNALVARHGGRAIFWSQVPIDVITIGPLAAIQTAFALDFVRRTGGAEATPP